MKVAFHSRKFIDKLLALSWMEPNRHEYRVSKFPYCPILDLEEQYVPLQKEDYSKTHYTTIGTITHENIQNKMPLVEELGDTVFGHWKCPSCNIVSEMGFHKREHRKVVKACKLEQEGGCPKQFTYEEISFKYGLLSGHLDLLSKSEDIWIAWEFKTTGSKLFLPNSYLERLFPQAKHKVQIRTYMALLRLQYGIKVEHYNIVYFNRDKPEAKVYTFLFTEKDFNNIKIKLDRGEKGRRAVNGWMTTGKAKYLEKIIEHKPCQSQADFLNHMKDGFFGKETCPHLETCIKKPVRVVRDIVKSGREK